MRITIMTNARDAYEYDRYLLRLAGCTVDYDNAEQATLVISDPHSGWVPPARFAVPVVALAPPIGEERLREVLAPHGVAMLPRLYPTSAFGKVADVTIHDLNESLLAATGWLDVLDERLGNTPDDVREALEQVVRATNRALARSVELKKHDA